jgi:Transcriptional regulator, AbiEi antitoxin
MTCNIRRDSEVWDLSRSRHGVVTAAQLRDLGFTRSAISHRLRTGRLWRLYPGVFAVGRPELSREGSWLAAVLACGEGAALSHLCAAGLLEIWEGAIPRWPQVSVPTDAGRLGPRGIRLHRAATLRTNDIIERNAIPVTTLGRTLIDLASVLDAKQLKSVLRQAERVHKLDLGRLRGSLDALPRTNHRRGRLASILDAYVPGTAGTEGEGEAAFLELCAH